MQALILAGGKGTRLRPYTTVFPKPLMPVGDLPILEIILRQLKRAGAKRIILAVGHMGQIFRAFFGEGDSLGLEISYSFEEHALGTAGPIGLVLDQLEEDFLVMNGDLLTTLPYRALFDEHCRAGSAATIAVYPREVKIDFGVVETEGSDLARYREKPVFRFDVSMGVNVMKRNEVSRLLTPGAYLDIPDLMMKLRDSGKPVRCYRADCRWLDIGRVDDYEAATSIFDEHRAEFLPPDQE